MRYTVRPYEVVVHFEVEFTEWRDKVLNNAKRLGY